MKKKNYCVIGVMSGTSMDGIDISIVKSDGINNYKHISSKYFSYSKSTLHLLSRCNNLFAMNKKNIELLYECEQSVTKDYISALKKFIYLNRQYKTDLISIHGQTVFHAPHIKSTIQLCNGEFIKESLNIPVVYDFRQRDILNGGEGAPLVPIFHRLISKIKKITLPAYFVNIGGISNITYIDRRGRFSAYDTGPGMCLLDQYVKLNKNKKFDVGGKYSEQGTIDFKTVHKLMNDKYFKLIPPKSLDRNYFSLKPFKTLEFNNACSSISAFTALSIIREIKKRKYNSIILSGGGIQNKLIVSLLKKELGHAVIKSDELNFETKFMESQAFAYLGVRSIKKLAISFPNTTGVKRPVSGGVLI